jgi:ribosomal protein L29
VEFVIVGLPLIIINRKKKTEAPNYAVDQFKLHNLKKQLNFELTTYRIALKTAKTQNPAGVEQIKKAMATARHNYRAQKSLIIKKNKVS